ncbi:MAG: O-antigen ligase family protein [Acidimicrobiales bacterium]|jgi:O-antigen ligase
MSTVALPTLDALPDTAAERSVRRRVGIVWGLLYFNVLTFYTIPLVVTIPHKIGQVLTQGSLVLAVLLALTVNRRLMIRTNAFLVLSTVAAVVALAVTLRGYVGLGSDVRAIRLLAFLAVLWLLTPFWGRRDLLLLRYHLRCLFAVLASVLLGMIISPHKAFEVDGRLTGVIWPVQPPQVAHIAAVAAGLTAVLWLSGLLRRNTAVVLFLGSVGLLILTHTRTALVAMLVGVLVAGLSLFVSRRRVRKAFMTTFVIVLIGALIFLPALSSWFGRGENTQELTTLTGRTVVWSLVVNAPRPRPEVFFGYGLSNDSFDGLSIDNSWVSVYQDEGLFGDVVCGLIVLCLLLAAAFRPRSPARAIALFLIVYCLISSFTETGLGEASPFMLDLAVAAALLAPRPPPALLQQE